MSQRYTSKDVRIEWIPNSATAVHVQVLAFESGASGGTFKLRVNGELTANITFNSTAATLVTNINSALDALANLDAGDIAASGTSISAITLTADSSKYYEIAVEAVALTGTGLSADPISSTVTTQGSELFVISAEMSSFEFEESIDKVDMTAISEYDQTELAVKRMLTWSGNMFHVTRENATDQSSVWQTSLQAGKTGRLTIYPKGKFVGKEYFSFDTLIDSFSQSYPDHEKVEIAFSGTRQGAMIVPFNSIYTA